MVEGAQLAYVGSAYAVAGLVVLGLVLWTVLDHHRQRRALAAMEGRGWREPRGEPGTEDAARPASGAVNP